MERMKKTLEGKAYYENETMPEPTYYVIDGEKFIDAIEWAKDQIERVYAYNDDGDRIRITIETWTE